MNNIKQHISNSLAAGKELFLKGIENVINKQLHTREGKKCQNVKIMSVLNESSSTSVCASPVEPLSVASFGLQDGR